MSQLAIRGGPQAAANFRMPAWPILGEEDRRYVLETLESCQWGRLIPNSRAEAFEKAFAAYHDARHGIAASNGTVTLELSLLAGGVRPGDEVLVPALTFIASASAIVRVGAIPIFVDSDPETLSISPTAAEEAITPRTRAIIAVHYGGYPVDFDALLPIAEKHDLLLIEDCAHAQGTEWRGRKVGAIGHFGSFSFQQTKSLSAGEGGIVLTNDAALAEQARLYHNIGRVVGRPGYEHLVIASNYRLPELSAALLSGQLSRLQEQVERRMAGADYLVNGLAGIGGITPQKPDERITQRGFYFLVLRYDCSAFSDLPLQQFLAATRAEGVPWDSGYGMPLYKQPAFRREHVAGLLGRPLDQVPDYPNLHLPVAEKFCAEEQLTLPHEVLLAEEAQLQLLLDAVIKVKEHAAELAVPA
jgi:dTDP-4-amino-4,6-dideoxygalactose transaminase